MVYKMSISSKIFFVIVVFQFFKNIFSLSSCNNVLTNIYDCIKNDIPQFKEKTKLYNKKEKDARKSL